MPKEINSKIITFIFLLIVALLLIFLDKVGYLNKVKSFTAYFSGNIMEVFQSPSNSINDFFRTIEDINEFKDENARLREENLKMNYEILMSKEIQRENEILRKQFKFSQNSCFEGVCIEWKTASVIGRDPGNFGKQIFINLGSNDGIQEGQAAVAPGGLLVGKVAEVFGDFSKIMLITDPKSSINSIIQTSRANGVVKGSYATGVKLEMVNQAEDLAVGDLIITSGLENKIPKGLIIGKVSRVEESANNVFKSAQIDMFADFNYIEEIFIADKYD